MVLGYTIYTRILLASYSGLTKYKQSTIQLSIEICGAADSSNLPGRHRVFQDRTRELQGCAPGSGGGGMAGVEGEHVGRNEPWIYADLGLGPGSEKYYFLFDMGHDGCA